MFLDTVARVCGNDRARLARVLAGVRRYQEAGPGAVRGLRPVIGEVGGSMLRDFGGIGQVVVVVPSLINPPTVLDLAPGNSLLDGLAGRGLRPLMVDWGPVGPAGLEELVETRLVPLVAGIGAPVAMLGYCLGGTLGLAAAAMLGLQVSRITLLATPWRFTGYGNEGGGLIDWWEKTGPLAGALGAVPMDLLQPAFWSLDAEGLAAKYERLATLPEAAVAAFAVLEDWSNTGEPLSLAAARGLAEDLFRDDMPGRGKWRIGGRAVDPGALGIPILDIIALRDRIVPPAAALSVSGVGEAMPLDAGHVGMVVGGRAPAMLWDPLAAWLRGEAA
ncbi:alpha/beta hydrolase [Sandarakinorhabdus glacialis]|uniref:alpha/beta hydrolase n=1 Tax=Sandarakinorhabdus glacialis TaxID=1614636 RepID=UPI001FB0C08C|nr:alpha/beta hydrolase [Polymorphobacter glacialis]